jgi:asparagine synthase (glutamine-hydrolysing)
LRRSGLEKKLQTFSVGFDIAEYDESEIALEVAETFTAQIIIESSSRKRSDRVAPEAVDKLDSPSPDAINTYIVSRSGRGGREVALSGLGGDEVFGGYPSFRDVPKLKFSAGCPTLRGSNRRGGGF